MNVVGVVFISILVEIIGLDTSGRNFTYCNDMGDCFGGLGWLGG